MDELKSLAEMAVEYLDLLVDATKELTEVQKENSEALKKATGAIIDHTKEIKKGTDEEKKKRQTVGQTKDALKKFGTELMKIANEGVKFGSAIGTSATKGVELELRNRTAVAGQLFKFNADLAVTIEQQKAAQQGFADAFISVREGSKLSVQGALELVQNLKKGFKSEFEPTAETFRMLTQMGITTTSQFDAFRKATGRASLSSNQLAALYNKNTLSFLLYGNSFAKAAANAERLGVNLAGVQAAQESLVMNLDGTIDTVAQLNQLGAQVDFGNLVRIAETEGPDALMKYVRATVPEYLMQGASTRALFKQLGISVEDYMKSGDKQVSAADALEKQMTKQAETTKSLTGFFATLGSVASKVGSILTGTFGLLAVAAFAAGAALFKLASQGGMAGITTIGGTAGRIAGGLGGIATGMTIGMAMGGTAMGSAIGSGIGTALGAFFGPIGMMVGGSIGGAIGGYLSKPKTAEDMFSGYGKRTLLTPTGAIALNNQDTVIAGTNLFKGDDVFTGPKDSLSLVNTLGQYSEIFNVLNVLRKARQTRFLLSKNPLLTANPYTAAATELAGGLVSGEGLQKSFVSAGGSLAGGLLGGFGGVMAGRLVGSTLGTTLGPAGTVFGGMLGAYLANKFANADDMISGYGSRTLLTPKGAYALNNADDLVAGTNLFPKGSVNMGGNTSSLEKKIDDLITVLRDAKTVVQVENRVEQVPRMAMAGVYTRNQSRG